MTTPAIIAAHLRTTTLPAVDAAGRALASRLQLAPPKLTGQLVDAARVLDLVNLASLAAHLAEQRRIAAEGRPRGESTGRGSAVPDPTSDTANEVARIRIVGLEVREALDRLHPDPSWPRLDSGLRARMMTCTEAVELCAREAFVTIVGNVWALEHLTDAVGNLRDQAREVHRLASRAFRVRAWAKDPSEVDPPPDLSTCEGRMRGEACGQHVSVHHHPDTGAVHLVDVCDDCYRLACPVCYERPRRTSGAQRCERCEKRAQRAA